MRLVVKKGEFKHLINYGRLFYRIGIDYSMKVNNMSQVRETVDISNYASKLFVLEDPEFEIIPRIPTNNWKVVIYSSLAM